MRKIIKDSATLIGGNVWAQAVGLLGYLLLTRLYTPEQFGLFTIFYSYIEVLIILGTGKYEMAVVRADNDREAAATAQFALRLNTWVSLVLVTIVSMLMLLDVMPDKIRTLGWVSMLIPLMVFCCGSSRVYAALFNRFNRFGTIAASEMVTATSGLLFKALFGVLQKGAAVLAKACGVAGLPLGTVLGQMAGNLNYRLRLRRLPLPHHIARSERQIAAGKHRRFPLYTMPKDWVNSFSCNLPTLWLALYFDDAVVGFFALAFTFCIRPANLLNSAFERIFYTRTLERVRRQQPVWPMLIRFVMGISAVSFLVLLAVFLFAEPLFGFCFGNRWTGCGYYVRSLLPWVFVSLSSTSLSFVASVFDKQRTEFLFFIVLLLLRVTAMAVGIYCNSFQLAILLFALAGTAVSLSLLIWYLSLVRHYEKVLKQKEL